MPLILPPSVSSGAATPWQTITSNYTAAAGDRLLVDATSSGFTISLPGTPGIGDEVTLARIDTSANAVTIATSDKIQGVTAGFRLRTQTQQTSGEEIKLVFSGATLGWVASYNDAAIFMFSSIPLTFSSFGDTNGVVYYQGFNGTTWTNPQTGGNLVVTSSSITGGTLAAITDRTTNSFQTNSSPGQSITFALPETRKLALNRITIRGKGDDFDQLRNWHVHGSNNNSDWILLDSRTNDSTITNSSWGGFVPNVSGAGDIAYRYLRVLSTGLNSNNNHVLALGEVEFYGTLEVSG